MLLAIMLVYTFLNQLNLALVRFQTCTFGMKCKTYNIIVLSACFYNAADPPSITKQPQELQEAPPGKPVSFTVRATGTKPLTYLWQWKPAGEETSSWQQCEAERFQDACSPKLIISSVQKLNEGSYRCVVNNCTGTQSSEPAKLSVGKIL